jgi:hypothetical protein
MASSVAWIAQDAGSKDWSCGVALNGSIRRTQPKCLIVSDGTGRQSTHGRCRRSKLEIQSQQQLDLTGWGGEHRRAKNGIVGKSAARSRIEILAPAHAWSARGGNGINPRKISIMKMPIARIIMVGIQKLKGFSERSNPPGGQPL